MSSDRPRNDPRTRGLWVGAVVLAGVGLLSAAGIALHQHQEVRRQLSTHEQELANLQLRADAVARASEELVRDHLVKSLRQAHPVVDTFAKDEGEAVDVMFLHQAGNGSRGGHGLVVWNAERTRGVLVVSPLPEPGADTYRLVGHSASGNASVTLAAFDHETAVPFALPAGFKLDRIEVLQAPASLSDGASAKLLLTSAEARL